MKRRVDIGVGVNSSAASSVLHALLQMLLFLAVAAACFTTSTTAFVVVTTPQPRVLGNRERGGGGGGGVIPRTITDFTSLVPRPHYHGSTSTTELFLFRRLLRKLGRGKQNDNENANDKDDETMTTSASDAATPVSEQKDAPPPPPPTPRKAKPVPRTPTEEADVCIIGAGVSGLTAALKACQGLDSNNADAATKSKKVVVLEADATVGGRVQSDLTANGFVLDRGFAVFIEEYPIAKELLDYNDLQLQPFLPGALVKLPNRFRLARVADPLRIPTDLFTALLAPVGGLLDKVKILPLIYHVRSSTVESLFAEAETSTLDALQNRWGFSKDMEQAFFQPFLEGIYLAPLAEQSSRMFSFVFKMFSEGAATLPTGGIGAVAQQLARRAKEAGADIRTSQAVKSMEVYKGGDDEYLIETVDGKTRIKSKSIIVAVDGEVAQKLVAQLDGFASLEELPKQPQRSVGNLYYSFKGEAPVTDPILVLNGDPNKRGTKEYPVNNICFPSVVNPSYAPEGYSLCSVTVLSPVLEAFQGDDPGLDHAVRMHLAEWFRDYRDDIYDGAKWKLEGNVYRVPKAQPGQLGGPYPANQNGGRPANVYRGKTLPEGVLVCGDHMATATLNGALESGIMAGQEAAKLLKQAKPSSASKAAA